MITMCMGLSFSSNVVLEIFGNKVLKIVLIQLHIITASSAHHVMHFLVTVYLASNFNICQFWELRVFANYDVIVSHDDSYDISFDYKFHDASFES